MNPYIGEIRLFSGVVVPRGWLPCDGQVLPIAGYNNLFAVIGTTYGGDGRTNFALPDFRGRVPLHTGQGRGLSPHNVGQTGGAEQQTLTPAQMPAHTHRLVADANAANSNTGVPTNAFLGNAIPLNLYSTSTVPMMTHLSPRAIATAGGSQPLATMSPYLCATFMIATDGAFPSAT